MSKSRKDALSVCELDRGDLELRILVLAPTGNDGRLTCEFLSQAGHQAYLCREVDQLCGAIDEGCGMIVLAEEALNNSASERLVAVLSRHPPWSDLPLALICSSGDSSRDRLQRLSLFNSAANITLLERPFRPGTLISTIEAGLRARRRQYELRQLLQEVQDNAERAGLISETAADLLLAAAPRDSLSRSFDRLAAKIGADASALHLRSADSMTLKLAHSRGLPEAKKARFAEIAVADAMRGGLSLGVDSPSLAEWRRLTRVRACTCQPLQIGERLLGTVVLASTTRERFNPGELQAVRAVCDLAAASLERARLIDQLRAARDTAENANRSKDDFLAALSHELRTPLNPVMLLASEAVQNFALPDEVRADFETIRKNIDLEARLIDDLLDLTRITRGKLTLDSRQLDLHTVVREAIETTRPDAEAKSIRLQLDLSSDPICVMADEVRLLQVFWNVLKNAVKFTPAGGHVVIRSFRDPSAARAVLEITDSGVGMTGPEIERAFKPFTQGDHAAQPSAHRFGGLGLGLAISHALVNLHGGTINARSEGRNRGATFTIELPLIFPTMTNEPAVTPPALSEMPSRASAKILLVEDHDGTRVALERLLLRRGYSVRSAATAAAARAFAETETFDLIISDLGLPDGTGYDLMLDFQRRFGLKGVALSGYGMEHDLERSRDAGFSAHLVKPVQIHTLETTLRDLLGALAV